MFNQSFKTLCSTQLGMLIGFGGFTAFALADVVSKWLTLSYDNLLTIVFWNYLSACLFLLCLRPFLPRKEGSTRSKRFIFAIHGVRALVNFLIGVLVVYSFSQLPISSVYTFLFTMPFFAAMIDAQFYNHPLTKPRIFSILVGFIGVVVAMRPGLESFNPLFIIPLATGVLIAVLFSISKSLEGQSVFSLGFWPLALAVMCLGPYVGYEYLHGLPLPAAEHIPYFLLLGVLNATGMTCVSLGFRLAPAAAVSPLLYTEMIWAIILGYLIFGDAPAGMMLLGAGIIIASGIYLIESERPNGSIHKVAGHLKNLKAKSQKT